jgi:hypothetical protein
LGAARGEGGVAVAEAFALAEALEAEVRGKGKEDDEGEAGDEGVAPAAERAGEDPVFGSVEGGGEQGEAVRCGADCLEGRGGGKPEKGVGVVVGNMEALRECGGEGGGAGAGGAEDVEAGGHECCAREGIGNGAVGRAFKGEGS